jgi:hypothetical protein
VFLPLVCGCLPGEKRRTFSPPDEDLLRAKADARLRKEAEKGGSERFAAIAVYRNDVFLDQSEALGRSSLTILNELGSTVILLLSPGQIVPLLKDPSLRKAVWFGRQTLLARLDPSLELDMLARFGAGTEERDVNLLLRFVDVGGAEEERHVATAGFRVVTRAGPTWVVIGPISGLPKLLDVDRIIYIEGVSQAMTMSPLAKPRQPSPVPVIKESASRQLIIKFSPGTIACTPSGIARFSATTHVSLEFVRTMSGDACVVKQIAGSADELQRGQNTLKEYPAVEYLEPDAVMKAS